jgi:hypothetical protein
MAKRPAYKSLYLESQANLKDAQYQVQKLVSRLWEINEALKPYGKQELEAYNRAPGPIYMDPLEYVASRAYIESLPIINHQEENLQGMTQYAWKGSPIIKVEAKSESL